MINPWHNDGNPFDATGEGELTANDPLVLINHINAHPNDFVLPPIPVSPPPFLDVNGDGLCTPGDVLAVINKINAGVAAAEARHTARQPMDGRDRRVNGAGSHGWERGCWANRNAGKIASSRKRLRLGQSQRRIQRGYRRLPLHGSVPGQLLTSWSRWRGRSRCPTLSPGQGRLVFAVGRA